MAGEPVQRRLQFVLEHFGKRPTENVVLNYFSLANEVYTITAGEQRFVVKNCFKNNSQALVENETALIRHLQKSGIATPGLVATKNGDDYLNYDGQFYVMNEFVAGYTPTWEDSIPESVFTESVRALADFHRAVDSFEFPNETGRLHSLELDAMQAWLESCRDSVNAMQQTRRSATEMVGICDEMLSLLKHIQHDIESLDLSVLKLGPIHGDLHCFNLIFSADQSRYISILDFDFIRLDYRLFDILWLSRSLVWHYAYVALFGCRPSPDSPPPLENAQQASTLAFTTLIQTYRNYHAISDEELRLLPLFVKLMPLYTIRFFSLENSEDECMRHVNWFRHQLDQLDQNVAVTTEAIEQALRA